MCTGNSFKSKGKSFSCLCPDTEVKPFSFQLCAKNTHGLKFQQCFLIPCIVFYLHARSLNFEAIHSVLLSALKWLSSQKKELSPLPAPGRGMADGLGTHHCDGALGVRPDSQLHRSSANHNVSFTHKQHRMRFLDTSLSPQRVLFSRAWKAFPTKQSRFYLKENRSVAGMRRTPSHQGGSSKLLMS